MPGMDFPMTRVAYVLMVAGLLISFAKDSEAACSQWGVSRLTAHQQIKYGSSPIKYLLVFQMNQNGSQLSGQAEYFHAVNPPRPDTGIKGALGGKGGASGFIRGNAIEITANWAPNSAGVYTGTIGADGHIRGVTYDRANPGARMDWYSAGPLSCAVELNTDRAGGDFRNFDLASGNFEECRNACAADQSCRAYTFVKPGVQGPRARCWLKRERPYSRANNCCVSGIIR